jgi:hypothetical protein
MWLGLERAWPISVRCPIILTSDASLTTCLALARVSKIPVSLGDPTVARTELSELGNKSSRSLHFWAVTAAALEIWVVGDHYVPAQCADEPFRPLQHWYALIAQHAIWTTYNTLSHSLVPQYLVSPPLPGDALSLSSQTEACNRRTSLAATLIRNNLQFKHGHIRQIDGVVLSFPYCHR